MSIAGPLSRRFEALDGLRGVSALMVVFFHATFDSHLWGAELVRKGWLFVDFFFVLSGFIIAHIYADEIRDFASLRRFVILRFGRLYPLHLAVLGFFVIYEIAYALWLHRYAPDPRPAFTGKNSPEGLVASLLLIHSFRIFNYLVWNTPSWSIGAEFYMYLLFAAVILSIGPKRLPPAMIVLAVMGLLYCSFSGPYEDQTFNGFGRCVAGFSIGALVRLVAPPAPSSSRLARTAIEVALGIAVIAFVIFCPPSIQFLAPLPFAIAVWVFSEEKGLGSDVLRSPPLRKLGDLSYSVYMVHLFVLLLLSNLVTAASKVSGIPLRSPIVVNSSHLIGANKLQGDLGLLLFVILVLGAAWITHRFIEVPFRSKSRLFAERVGARQQSPAISRPRPHNRPGSARRP